VGYKRVLLVEGKDDLHVISHLLKQYEISCIEAKANLVDDSKSIYIKETEGVDSLLSTLSILLDDGDLNYLAVILDADTNIQARWQSVVHILEKSGQVELPKQPEQNGTVLFLEQTGRNLTVGVWLMPNNKMPGMLEDFIQFLVPKGNRLLPYAKDCVHKIPTEDVCFPAERKSKAEIHTWLAWQKEPGRPLGIAMRSRYLDAQAKEGKILVNWIRRIFGSN
jgi:hypothetical protein